MQFSESSGPSSSARIGYNRESVNRPLQNEYKYMINFYNSPPYGKISLEDAEDYVIDRLNILQVFDALRDTPTIGKDKNYYSLLEANLKSAETKFEANIYSGCFDHHQYVHKTRVRDHISHFLLRLYYCRTDALRKWFISTETELFRYRLSEICLQSYFPTLLKDNGFNYETVSDKEKAELFRDNKLNWNNSKTSATAVIYCLPFEDAYDLVRKRKVFLRNGKAYIFASEMVNIITNHFRMEISHSLAVMQMALPQLEEDERLIPRFHALHINQIQNRKSAVKTDESGRETVTPDMIDTLSKESFPPCMRNIHETFRKEHHLRHYGRLHYGLFLKSIGLSLDDALNFFRDEFIQKVTPDRYQKEYAYNIRYNYGKEGKRVNISAYSCHKIINDNPPGPSDTHGCPFKHFDTNNLKQMLRRFGILSIVEEKKDTQNCTSACGMLFALKHQWYPQLEKGIIHPNQFYTESRKALKMSLLTPPESADGSQTNDISMNDITFTTVNNSIMKDEEFDDYEFDTSMNEYVNNEMSNDIETGKIPIETIKSETTEKIIEEITEEIIEEKLKKIKTEVTDAQIVPQTVEEIIPIIERADHSTKVINNDAEQNMETEDCEENKIEDSV